MRVIKFRGQRKDTKEWVYGSYLISDKVGCSSFEKKGIKTTHWILPIKSYYLGDKVEVIPETVGQFTGLKDKNNKEYYHNDILKYNNQFYIIEWNEGGWIAKNIKNKYRWLLSRIHQVTELQGNIHTATKEQLKEWGIKQKE